MDFGAEKLELLKTTGIELILDLMKEVKTVCAKRSDVSIDRSCTSQKNSK
jgi:hypothetical protein